MVTVGTDSHQIDCLVTLSSSIGPNISALSISWLHNDLIIKSSLGKFQVSETMISGKQLSSSLTLSDISEHDSGEYCCTASIAGNQTKLNDCIGLKVTTDGEYNRVAVTRCNVTTFSYNFWQL